MQLLLLCYTAGFYWQQTRPHIHTRSFSLLTSPMWIFLIFALWIVDQQCWFSIKELINWLIEAACVIRYMHTVFCCAVNCLKLSGQKNEKNNHVNLRHKTQSPQEFSIFATHLPMLMRKECLYQINWPLCLYLSVCLCMHIVLRPAGWCGTGWCPPLQWEPQWFYMTVHH